MNPWNGRVETEYARQVLAVHFIFGRMLFNGNKAMAASIDDILQGIDLSDRAQPAPFGDIYFIDGVYHVGKPVNSSNARGYEARAKSGKLESGAGRVLAYLLCHLDEEIPAMTVQQIGCWRDVGALQNLRTQLKQSDYFSLENYGSHYVMQLKKQPR